MTRLPVLSELPYHRRQAKKLAKEEGVVLNVAQNRIALRLGFQDWSLMVRWCSSTEAPKNPAEHEQWLHRELLRSYIHGDQYELDGSQFFCSRCGRFVGLSHFRGSGFHKDSRDVDIYICAMEAEARRAEPSTEYFRPLDAPNALAERAAKRRLPDHSGPRAHFHRWLEMQTGREDDIGDFARFAMRDPKFPMNADSFDAVLGAVGRKTDCLSKTARAAWDECMAAQAYMQRRASLRFDGAVASNDHSSDGVRTISRNS